MNPRITPCDRCGNVNLDWDRDWFIPDEEWKIIIPEEWRNKTLCPLCFVAFAYERNIHYQPAYYDNIIVGLERIELEN